MFIYFIYAHGRIRIGSVKSWISVIFCIKLNYISIQTTVLDACTALREKLSEIKGLGPAAQYGLFLADEDPKKGVWLEPGRTLEHYLLRENVSIQI